MGEERAQRRGPSTLQRDGRSLQEVRRQVRFRPTADGAQGYQESGLDQSKRSRWSDRVMQVMPATARDKASTSPTSRDSRTTSTPDQVRPLGDRQLLRRSRDHPDQQSLFAFASYNAGRAGSPASAAGSGRRPRPEQVVRNVEVVAAKRSVARPSPTSATSTSTTWPTRWSCDSGTHASRRKRSREGLTAPGREIFAGCANGRPGSSGYCGVSSAQTGLWSLAPRLSATPALGPVAGTANPARKRGRSAGRRMPSGPWTDVPGRPVIAGAGEQLATSRELKSPASTTGRGRGVRVGEDDAHLLAPGGTRDTHG